MKKVAKLHICFGQNGFLQSLIYPSEKTIYWNKQHFGVKVSCLPNPRFLHHESIINYSFFLFLLYFFIQDIYYFNYKELIKKKLITIF